MKKKLILFLIVISSIILYINCQPPKHTEKEPNNLRNNANLINPKDGLVIHGKIEDNTDKDYFMLDFSNINMDITSFNIKVTGVKGIDMRLSIFYENDDKPFKIVNDFMKGDGESLTGIKAEKGDKLIFLIDANLTNIDNVDLGSVEQDNPDYPFIDFDDYQIVINMFNSIDRETEPNDIFHTADNIIIGKPLTGYFTPFLQQEKEINEIEALGNYNYYERDLYKITSEEESNDNEDIFVSIALSETENVNSFLVLFDGQGNILEFVDNQPFGYGEKILNYTLKSDDTYYIGVMGIHMIKVDSVDVYKYNLLVNYLDDSLNIERENNDSPEKANDIVSGSVSGFISPANDEDWFALIVPEEEIFIEENSEDNDIDDLFISNLLAEVKISGVEGVNIALDVSRNGNTINQTYDNTGQSEGETISNITVEGLDKLFVRVRRSNKDKRNFVNEENKYVLSYRFYYQKDNMELEPNNNIGQATEVRINSPIIGYINPIEDVDNYKITLENSRKYTIQVNTVDNINLQWQMFEESGLKAPNEMNLNDWDFKVEPSKGQDSYAFKYIGESYLGETTLILSIRDYKRSNSSKYNGQGFNPSQMYSVRIIPRKD